MSGHPKETPEEAQARQEESLELQQAINEELDLMIRRLLARTGKIAICSIIGIHWQDQALYGFTGLPPEMVKPQHLMECLNRLAQYFGKAISNIKASINTQQIEKKSSGGLILKA